MHVIDVGNPAAPSLVATLDTPGLAAGIAVSGKHVYVADGGRLRVIDACDQTAPVETGFYTTPGAARKVALDGKRAFVADEWGGLIVVRYTGPGSITVEKQADFADQTSFNFGGDLGGFALKAGATKVFPEVSSGDYEILENVPVGWTVDNVSCDSANAAQILNGVTIELQDAEDVTCTFNNKRLAVTAAAGGPYAANEGTAIALDASASSNLEMINTFKWDCTNDGSWDVTAASPVGSTCTYADDGAFTIKLRTWDIFGQTSTDTTTADISNVAPQVNAGPDLTAVAGAAVHFAGTFTDPGQDDTHTISWDFGDGSQQSGTLTPVHTYSATGQYTVMLTVMDDDGGSSSDTLIADIAGEGPVVSEFSAAPAEIPEGAGVVLSGNITQDPPGSPLTLDISWGDGETTMESLAAGSSSFSLQHNYVDDNPSGTPADDYIISLELSDDLGAFNATAVVQVNNVPPTVDAGADRVVSTGIGVPFSAAVSDPGLDDTHILTWDFGDGSAAGTGSSVEHSYAEPGEYTVTVTVEDDDGGLGSDTIMVTVQALVRLPILMRS
jgi:PKD repeat protein